MFKMGEWYAVEIISQCSYLKKSAGRGRGRQSPSEGGGEGQASGLGHLPPP